MIAGDLDYLDEKKLNELSDGIGDIERMLKALIKSLEAKHLDP